jgi:hypothetical protein
MRYYCLGATTNLQTTTSVFNARPMTVTNIGKREGIIVFGFFLICFAILYPDLFFLRLTPMGGDPWTLQDPAISWTAFMPGWREFRYELLNEGNVLWSTLRAMGQPMLGNGVQAAPLFPLNLALIALPDTLYWSAMPILRIVLTAVGLFFIARHIFNLSVAASLLFALMSGFNLNMFRWINHPWCNGILAGVWYIYFSCRIITPTNGKLILKKRHIFGLVISVFAMVTAGFPEASAVSALLALFVFSGVLMAQWHSIRPNLGNALYTILLCHLAGFCLSAVQLFALIEYIDFTLAMDLREGYIGGGYDTSELGIYALAQFTIFWKTAAQKQYLAFYIGFIGLFFLFRGITALFLAETPSANELTPKRRLHRYVALAFIGSMLLFIVKSFKLSPVLEWIFAHTPVLGQSHFPFYFAPLLYFGLAYFSALGLDSFVDSLRLKRGRRIIELVISAAAITIVLYIAYRTANQFSGTSSDQFWNSFLNAKTFAHARAFAVFGFIVMLLTSLSLTTIGQRIISRHSPLIGVSLSFILLGILLFEYSLTSPKNFSPRGHSQLENSADISATVLRAIEKAPLPRHELRGYSQPGAFTGEGLATIDNGISAMLGPEMRALRLALFNTQYGGYLQLDSAKKAWSYDALSNNIKSIHMTPKVDQDWSNYRRDPKIDSRIEGWNDRVLQLINPFFLQGNVASDHKQVVQPEIWIKLQGAASSFWIKGNLSGINVEPGKNETGRRIINTNWRMRVPVDWLREESYQLSIRVVDPLDKTFQDSAPISLRLDRSILESTQQGMQKLASSEDNTRHIYFNPNALPRAFIASRCELLSDWRQVKQYLADSPQILDGIAALNQEDSWPNQICENYRNEFARVPIKEDGSSNLDFGVIAGPALLIVNDSHYPGWHAYDQLSGSELEIKPANLAVRAVFLPENRDYHVEMKYRPWWLNIVYLLLVVAVIICAYLWRRSNRQDKVHTNRQVDMALPQ